jgi:hypothetical protein
MIFRPTTKPGAAPIIEAIEANLAK